MPLIIDDSASGTQQPVQPRPVRGSSLVQPRSSPDETPSSIAERPAPIQEQTAESAEREQQAALIVLKPYERAPGQYDIAGYLWDKESPAEGLQTLRKAGFSDKDIQDATHQNVQIANEWNKEAKRPLYSKLWQATTPWDESKGEHATPGKAFGMVADNFIPLVWTRHLKEGMPGYEVALNVGVDLLTLIPLAGWAGRTALTVKTAGKSLIVTRSLAKTIEIMRPATSEIKALAKASREANIVMKAELRTARLTGTKALMEPAKAARAQAAIQSAKVADEKFVAALDKMTNISRKGLVKIEKLSGRKGMAKSIVDINTQNAKLAQEWKTLKLGDNLRISKSGSTRYAKQLKNIETARAKLDKSIARYGEIMKPRAVSASAGYENAFRITQSNIDNLNKEVKFLEGRYKEAFLESNRKAIHEEWLTAKDALNNEIDKMAALEKAHLAGMPSPYVGYRTFFRKPAAPAQDMSQLYDDIARAVAERKPVPVGAGKAGKQVAVAEKTAIKQGLLPLETEAVVEKPAVREPIKAPKITNTAKIKLKAPIPKVTTHAGVEEDIKLKLKSLPKVKTDTATQTEAVASTKAGESPYEKTRTGTKTSEQQKTDNATREDVDTKISTKEKESVKESTKLKTQTSVKTHLRTPYPEVPARTNARFVPKIPITGDDEKQEKTVFPKGTVAWKQGMGWWVIKPPYKRPEDRLFVMQKPRGAIITSDARSAAGTIQSVGGPSPVDLNFDMGVVDVSISNPPQNPDKPRGDRSIRFRRDHDRTYGGIRPAPSRKVGPYHYRAGGLSRKPM